MLKQIAKKTFKVFQSAPGTFSSYFPLIFEPPHSSILNASVHSVILGYKMWNEPMAQKVITTNIKPMIKQKNKKHLEKPKSNEVKINIERIESINRNFAELLLKMKSELNNNLNKISNFSQLTYKTSNYLVI